MKVESSDLREHFATLSGGELRAVVAAPDGVYTTDARDAARQELANRPSRSQSDEESAAVPAPSRWDRTPRGIRLALKLAVAFGFMATLFIIIFAVLEVPSPSSERTAARATTLAFGTLIAILAVALTLVYGILTERWFVRAALLVLLAAGLVYEAWLVMHAPTMKGAASLLLPIYGLWYLLRNEEVVRYYRELAARTI